MLEARATAVLDRSPEAAARGPRARRLLEVSRGLIRRLATPSYPPVPSIEAQMRDMLPPPVNQALNTGIDLDRGHIDMVNRHGLVDTAMYLTLQVMDGDPRQRDYLEEFVQETLDANNPNALQDITDRRISAMSADAAVPFVRAKKIKQINALGFKAWANRFGELTSSAHAEMGTATPIVLAYAGLMGLRPMLSEYQGTGIDIVTLRDPEAMQPDEPTVGYRISTSSEAAIKVTPLPRNFDRPRSYYLIDDTRRTGRHLRRVEAMLQGGGATEMEPNHFYVVQVNRLVAMSG